MTISSFKDFCQDFTLSSKDFSVHQLETSGSIKEWNDVITEEKRGKAEWDKATSNELNFIEEQLEEEKSSELTLHNSKNKNEKIIEKIQRESEKRKEHYERNKNSFNSYMQRYKIAQAKLNQKDVNFLLCLRNTERAYRNITGFMWDYPRCNESILRGYIRNNFTGRMKMVELNIEGMQQHDIWETLWMKIESTVK